MTDEEKDLSKEERHIGRIEVTNQLMLEFLRFKGGRILRVYQDPNRPNPSSFMLAIEHPEMPKCPEGAIAEVVHPIYTAHFGDNNELLRIERKSLENG